MQRNNLLLIAALSGFCAVAFGAFGAHGLKKLVTADMLAAYETGVRYQFYHTLAILFLSFQNYTNVNPIKRAALFFVCGILLFSGSLYLMALTSISGKTFTWLGPITPLGGVCFLIGWVNLLLFGLKQKNKI